KCWLVQSLQKESEQKEFDQVAYDTAQEILRFLNCYGLISFYPHDSTFSIHGYFQEIIRASQKTPKNTLQNTLNCLIEFPEIRDYNPNDLETPINFANILPHCLSVLEYSKRYHLSPKDVAPLKLTLIR